MKLTILLTLSFILLCVRGNSFDWDSQPLGVADGPVAFTDPAVATWSFSARDGTDDNTNVVSQEGGICGNTRCLTGSRPDSAKSQEPIFAFSTTDPVLDGEPFSVTVEILSQGNGGAPISVFLQSCQFATSTTSAGACDETTCTELQESSALQCDTCMPNTRPSSVTFAGTVSAPLVGSTRCFQIVINDAQMKEVTARVDNIVLGSPPPVMGGDPHFRPLNGDDVWFTPVGPKTPAVYNLITHPLLQLNTEWEQSTNYEQLITSVGLMAYAPETQKETRVQITMTGRGRNATLVVTIDGNVVTHGVSADIVVWKGKNRVEVTTKLAVFTYFIAYSKPDSYIDFDVAKVNKSLMQNAHGILGQTAKTTVPYRQPNEEELIAMKRDPLLGCTKCYVEGNVGDYIVTEGIFGKTFAHNLFRK